MENKRPRIRPELAEKIERARSDVPFDRWVNRLIEKFFEGDMDWLEEQHTFDVVRSRKPPAF